jgi:PAS domain-containing protein
VLALLLASTAHVNGLIGTRDRLIVDLASDEQEARAKATETTLQSIGDAVIATDAAGKIQFMNAVAEGLPAGRRRLWPRCRRCFASSTNHPRAGVNRGQGAPRRCGSALQTTPSWWRRTTARFPSTIAWPIQAIIKGYRRGTGVVWSSAMLQRRQAQRELEESERYRLLFDSIRKPCGCITRRRGFLMVNEAAIECYGYSKSFSMTTATFARRRILPHWKGHS